MDNSCANVLNTGKDNLETDEFCGRYTKHYFSLPMTNPQAVYNDPAGPPDKIIRIRDLVKLYGEEYALGGVSLDVERGDTLALIGSSGSGKTTILKSINGLVTGTSGTIEVYGKSINQWNLVELRRRIGYVIQQVGLFPHYTVEKNIRLVPELMGWGKDIINDRVHELLEKIHIPRDMKDRFPDELSGGEQQRIGLARALAADPEIVLMDEPFGALDPIIRAGMQREFLNMDSFSGKTIILVTHDMGEAAILADRICLLEKGSIQQIGTLRELLFTPANQFVRQFLDPHRYELEMRAILLSDMKPYLSETILAGLEEDMSLSDIETKKSAEVRKQYYLHRNEILDKIGRC